MSDNPFTPGRRQTRRRADGFRHRRQRLADRRPITGVRRMTPRLAPAPSLSG